MVRFMKLRPLVVEENVCFVRPLLRSELLLQNVHYTFGGRVLATIEQAVVPSTSRLHCNF